MYIYIHTYIYVYIHASFSWNGIVAATVNSNMGGLN